MKSFHLLIAAFLLMNIAVCAGQTLPSPELQVSAEAPPKHAFLKETLGGAYYVPYETKKEYDSLLSRVHDLEADLAAERKSGPDVLRELDSLKPRLDALRQEIEKARVLVTALKAHTQREKMTFDLGPERMLVISAGRVRIQGWDKPQVKCVLTKTVLGTKDDSVDQTLQSIQLEHHYGLDPKVVGEPPANRGKRINYPSGQRSSYRHVMGEAELALFAAFQGRAIDTVGVMNINETNEEIFMRFKSPGGDSAGRAEYRRHADLTVYVPKCNSIAIGGCSSLDVEDVDASLVLTRVGGWSGDEMPDDTRKVHNLHGSLFADGVDLNSVENVDGPVTITIGNHQFSSTMSEKPTRMIVETEPPQLLVCRKINGNLTARLLRVNLLLEEIRALTDVTNDFGDTTWNINTDLHAGAHRVISQSGRIEVNIAHKKLGDLPISALSECGSVQINGELLGEASDVLSHLKEPVRSGDANIVLSHPMDPVRTVYGITSLDINRDRKSSDQAAARLDSVRNNTPRSPGIDILSRSGTVVLRYDNP